MAHEAYQKEVPGSDTAVLFIHGILGTPQHFRRFYPEVPAGVSIYSILLDGHGGPVEGLSKTSMARWKAQVRATMEGLVQRYRQVVLVAHSMGALFAIELGLLYPHQVKALLLLDVPLAVGVKPSAVTNSLRVIFHRVPEGNEAAKAAQAAFGLTPTKKLWRYAGWLPRYCELFGEIRRVRGLLPQITVPCVAFQSCRDELVAHAACRYLRESGRVTLVPLKRSGHFYYDKRDFAKVLSHFRGLL